MENDQFQLNPPQKVEWWRRIIGVGIDSFIILAIITLEISATDLPRGDSLITGVFFMIAQIPYYFFTESLFNRTLGKKLCGMVIIDSKSYDYPSTWQILGRTLARLIPFDGLSFFWGEVWHDSLSSTKIVSTSEKLRYDLNKNELDYDDMGFFQKFGYRLKNLSEGNYRLLLVGSVLLPLIVTFLKYKSNSSLYVEDFIEKFIITTLIYWILTWFALWIYEGFQEN